MVRNELFLVHSLTGLASFTTYPRQYVHISLFLEFKADDRVADRGWMCDSRSGDLEAERIGVDHWRPPAIRQAEDFGTLPQSGVNITVGMFGVARKQDSLGFW